MESNLELTIQPTKLLLHRCKTTVARKGIISRLGLLLLPAPKTALPDSQLALKLDVTLTPCLH